MLEVGIKQAKSNLSQLFEEALKGEVIIITRNGKERVQLVPCQQPHSPNGFGMFAERFKDLPEDYWTNPNYEAEFLKLFRDSDE